MRVILNMKGIIVASLVVVKAREASAPPLKSKLDTIASRAKRKYSLNTTRRETIIIRLHSTGLDRLRKSNARILALTRSFN